MENPMQLTMVKDVPLVSSGALCAIKVENKGESAITTSPQLNRNRSSKKAELFNKKSGENIQNRPDKNSEIIAIFLGLNFWESKPLKTQATPPKAMIRNEKKGTFRFVPG